MLPMLLLLFNPVLAQEIPRNDISIDFGASAGCFLGCLTYDRQVTEKLDLGLMATALLLFNGGGLYGQYTLHSSEKNNIFIEPSVGIIWSPLSREIFYNGVVSLGLERDFKNSFFYHGHLGGGVLSYDLDSIGFLPDIRLGVGKRF